MAGRSPSASCSLPETHWRLEGSLYPALHRLERKGWIKASWGLSENNRKAKYYELTLAGRRQLEEEITYWQEFVSVMTLVLDDTV